MSGEPEDTIQPRAAGLPDSADGHPDKKESSADAKEGSADAREGFAEVPGGTVCAIGAGARFEGLLSFWGAARIEGSLQGEIASRGTLEVGPAASVVGRVEVDVLIVEGVVEGEVFARERVEVLPGAQVTATIRTPRLAVAEGAHFEGRLDMVHGARTGSSAASAA